MLETPHLERMIANCNCAFDAKQLIVNNVTDRAKVQEDCKALLARRLVDNCYFAGDYAEQVLREYGIDKNSFRGGITIQ